MAERRTMQTGNSQTLPVLPPSGPHDTQTAWEDLWAATRKARQTLAGTETPYGAVIGLPGVRAIGQRITEEINSDPEEVARLKRARKNARDGKTFPRHDDEKSS